MPAVRERRHRQSACADAPAPVPSAAMSGTATIAALWSSTIVRADDIIAIAT
jgi:hypothetical protein